MPQALAVAKNDLRRQAALLKALADETRLAILAMLWEGEMCVCEIMDALPLSQPAVSHHLKILRQVGLVTDRREGRWVYYDLDPVGLAECRRLFEDLPVMRSPESRPRLSRRQHPRCRE